MQGAPSLCFYCRHRGRKGDNGLVCAAFPGGIPEAILQNNADHRQPIDGDRGVQFEERPDAPHDLLAWTIRAIEDARPLKAQPHVFGVEG